MAGRSLRVAALLVALLVALLAACGGSAGEGPTGELTGTRLDPPFDVAGTPLQDASGAPYSLTEDTEKPLTLVFFGYTSCPDICGQVMATLAGTMARLSDADREQVEVVFVTTDPARDDAEVVADYTSRFDPEFRGLTGDHESIAEVAASMKVAIGYFEPTGEEIPVEDLRDRTGAYDVDHGTQVFAIDEQDGVSVYWNQDVSQAELAGDVHLLLAEAEADSGEDAG